MEKHHVHRMCLFCKAWVLEMYIILFWSFDWCSPRVHSVEGALPVPVSVSITYLPNNGQLNACELPLRQECVHSDIN